MNKLKSNEECRHGDLSFHALKELPKNLKEIKHDGSFILAFGEATGHHHKITVKDKDDLKIYQDAEGRYIMDVKGEATLTHQEHDTITFASGVYIQEIETERDPFLDTIRQVKD